MTQLTHDLYLSHIRNESQRFRVALADCDLSTRVPSCPDWKAADLLWHLGVDVQDFWAWIIEHRPEGPDGYPEPTRPDSPAGLFEAFDTATARLSTALASVPPDEHVWTWSTDQTAGFIGRRQAHEALIHRLDAELTAGKVTELDPGLAADGVQECLAVMYGGCPPWGTFTPGEGLLRFDLTDVEESVWVRLGRFTGTDPDDGKTYDEPDLSVVSDPVADPDAVVAGAAGPMDAWLWHRGDADVTVTGNRAVYDRFAALVTSPIN
ncbi:MAG TPA: maleylpyruvate isomerase N-terminal domain-containing protein [Nocardioides sp.]|nr:maleylpyruvate isomerase N-terminal domain-containing protein [Nocardioides sp.]